MPPIVASFVCVLVIIGFFRLNRDPQVRTSVALWLPVVWFALAASRALSQWLASFGFGFGVQATPDQYLEGSPLDRNLYLALTLIAAIVLLQRGQRIGRLLRANSALVVFFLYCGASILWSDYPDVTFKRWIKALGDLLMVLIILTETDQWAAIKRALSRVGFVLLPVSILFIRYYPNLGRVYSSVGVTENVGVTTTKNILGMITMIFGLGSLWCFLQAYRRRKSTPQTRQLIAHSAFLAVVIYLLSIASSATALSCFVLAGALLLVTNLSKRGGKPAVARLLVIGIVSISLIALFGDPGGNLVGTLGRDATLTGRTDIWKLSLSMAGNPVVGTGFESFWLGWRVEKTWNAYQFHLQEAHSGYIETYLTLGWAGIALLATLVMTGYRNIMASFRQNPEMASIKLAFFSVVLIYNLTEAAFRTQNPIWILFLWAVIAVPGVAAAEDPAQLGIPLADDVAESKTEVDYTLHAGVREKIT